jgi:hypothetical protein
MKPIVYKFPKNNFKIVSKTSIKILSLFILFGFISCSKDEPTKIIETPTNPTSTTIIDADYVLTSEFRGSNNAIILWKDGVSRDISNGTYDEVAIDMKISGNDVYILAQVNFTSTSKAIRVYKNGTPTDITVPNATTTARAIDVVGSDVYVAGEFYNSTTNSLSLAYWKGAIKNDLLSNVNFSSLNDIKVVGNSVYVLGTIRNANGNSEVNYWKDGVKTTIVNAIGINSEASSFDVVGNTVHIAGYRNVSSIPNSKRPFYWNNTTGTELTSSTTPTGDEFANDISVSNGDVYIVGEANIGGKFRASLWKGLVQNIIEPTTAFANFANRVQVNGTVVYVGGRQKFASNIEKATVWKAGVASSYVTTTATSSSLVDMHFKP